MPQGWKARRYQSVDTLSHTIGRHDLKAGVDVQLDDQARLPRNKAGRSCSAPISRSSCRIRRLSVQSTRTLGDRFAPRERRPPRVAAPFVVGIFRLLIRLCLHQVLTHQVRRPPGLAIANRLIDAPMRFRDRPQVAAAIRGLAALLVEQRRNHFDDGGEDGIAGGGADRGVEADVLDEERLRLLARGEHPADRVGDRRQLLGGATLGRHPGDADLQRSPRLEHLGPREPVQGRQQAQGFAVQDRRAVGDEGAGAVADDDQALGRQGLQAGADAGAADADLADQLTLGRQALSGTELPPARSAP